MATPKSPFLVFQNFISPKRCEGIVSSLNLFSPDTTVEGDPLMVSKSHEKSEQIIFEQFTSIIPQIEQHYYFKHKGTEEVKFEYYSQGVESKHQCENSFWNKSKKWTRVKDRDFTCVLFLSSYQENVPFDSDFEVYGGKLEFPQHKFGFNPDRGTLIVFPSGPHFINVVAPIMYGDLFMARFHIAATMPYIYQSGEFPGNYTNWFNDL